MFDSVASPHYATDKVGDPLEYCTEAVCTLDLLEVVACRFYGKVFKKSGNLFVDFC